MVLAAIESVGHRPLTVMLPTIVGLDNRPATNEVIEEVRSVLRVLDQHVQSDSLLHDAIVALLSIEPHA